MLDRPNGLPLADHAVHYWTTMIIEDRRATLAFSEAVARSATESSSGIFRGSDPWQPWTSI